MSNGVKGPFESYLRHSSPLWKKTSIPAVSASNESPSCGTNITDTPTRVNNPFTISKPTIGVKPEFKSSKPKSSPHDKLNGIRFETPQLIASSPLATEIQPRHYIFAGCRTQDELIEARQVYKNLFEVSPSTNTLTSKSISQPLSARSHWSNATRDEPITKTQDADLRRLVGSRRANVSMSQSSTDIHTVSGEIGDLAAKSDLDAGVAPTDYKSGDRIPLLVNHLTPSLHHASNQHKINSATYVYSYDYYYPKFHFCKPEGGPQKQSESLGSIIFGDRIFNSPFELNMLEKVQCRKLCTSKYPKADSVFVNRNIRAGYNHNWLVDGLPVASIVQDARTNTMFYGTGFHIGEVDADQRAVLYNHFDIVVDYHQRSEDIFRVVGVTAAAMSLDRSELPPDTPEENFCDFTELKAVHLDKEKDTDVVFTYSVRFEKSDVAWATRWDKYLHVYDPKIQWFSLINFSLIVLILGIVIAHILIRTLKNDIVKYNEVNLDDDISDESGWKLVHGDVFRPPVQRLLLSVLVGSGAQIFLMAFVTIIFALFGLLSPSNRGALSTFMLIVYIGSSVISSFISGYLYRFLGGDNWKLNMILTPLLVPGSLFGVFVFLNFFLISVDSSGAVPMGTMVAIIVIWFAISIPLSIAGSILASKRPLLDVPVRTNQIPRQIPQQPWYLKSIPVMLISGIFPFGSIAVEMYFIYSSLWFNKIFYMFGFLFFCFLLMILTTSLITVLMVYYTLCSENYKWQWKSILIGGGCAVYVFIHSLFLTGGEKLGGLTSMVLYTGYSIVISLLVFLCCASVGFISSLFFVRTIYGQIKID
ncbi:uncharacterized protein LODBEIA_P48360 [Lodderomyces beijingensis]|uniref:Transmembrane 9 superfamily member n=1 Tax=Lodderomyces beijingensis TaxID=1775926 RepID=A0ABP0ZTB5_9ASCO